MEKVGKVKTKWKISEKREKKGKSEKIRKI